MPPVHDSATAMVAPRAASAAASRATSSATVASIVTRTARAAITTSVAERRDEVVEQDAEPLRPADRRAAAPLEALVGPGDRSRLGRVEEAEQDERDQLGDERRRRDEPEDEPERDDLVPDDGPRIDLIQVARGRRCTPTSRRRRRRGGTHRALASPSALVKQGEDEPRDQIVPAVPGATGDRPLPKPSAIQCAGCERRKRTPGLRPGPTSGRWSAVSGDGSDFIARLRCGSGRTTRTRPRPERPRGRRGEALRPPRSGRCARRRRPPQLQPRRPRRAATAGR